MVFDRRFTAASRRYSGSDSNAQLQSAGLRPPLQDYYVLLTRSFLMVLGSRPWMRSALVLNLSTRGKEPVNVRAELGTERVGVLPPPLANTRSRE